MPGNEKVFVIRLKDIDSREAVFRNAIQSVSPTGSKYPIIFRCLHEDLETEDPKAVLAEARAMRADTPNMRFWLERGKVVYEQVLVEVPPVRLDYLPTRLLFSPYERYRIETTRWPPRPIRDRIEEYLDGLIRGTEMRVR